MRYFLPHADYAAIGQAIRDGNSAVFAEFYKTCYPHILRSIKEQVECPLDSEKIAQDTFSDIWQYRANSNPSRGSFSGWCLTIAKRKIFHYQRAKDRHKRSHIFVGGDGLFDAMESPEQSPLQQLVDEDTYNFLMTHLEDALLNARREHRIAWILYRLNDYSYEQTGRILGVSRTSAFKYIQKCDAHIRTHFAEKEVMRDLMG